MMIGDIEKHLHDKCNIGDLEKVTEAIETLVAFLPKQLKDELYLLALAGSVGHVTKKKKLDLAIANGLIEERCRHCTCLTMNGDFKWWCTEAEKPILEIEECPCGKK